MYYMKELSKEGVFTILSRSEDKLISRRTTPEKIGISKRRYYSRLRTLKALGLVVKDGEGYILTEAGEKVLENLKEIAFTLLLSRSKIAEKKK